MGHIANDITGQGADLRREAGFLEEIDAESGRGGKADPDGGNEASNVGIGCGERDTGAEAGNAGVAELAEHGLAAIELNGQEDGGLLPVEELEVARHDSDDGAGLAVDEDAAADD